MTVLYCPRCRSRAVQLTVHQLDGWEVAECPKCDYLAKFVDAMREAPTRKELEKWSSSE
jgi:Zn ribbon nucleic-acid-binding protein